MIKWTIKYTDYDGNEQEEPFYFNLNKAELMQMNFSKSGGYEKFLQRIIDTKDLSEIIDLFKTIILKAYGVKSDDGKRFMKSPEMAAAFEQTEAFSELFMQLATDNEAAQKFIIGLMPADLQKEALARANTNALSVSE